MAVPHQLVHACVSAPINVFATEVVRQCLFAGRRARCVHAKFEASGKPTLNPIDIESVTLPSGLVDYYQLLDVPQTAKQCEIKTAYRQLQKLCHPDILGPEKGSDMSILLNQVCTRV